MITLQVVLRQNGNECIFYVCFGPENATCYVNSWVINGDLSQLAFCERSKAKVKL